MVMTVAPKATVLDSHPSAYAVRDEKRGVAMIVARSAQSKDGSQILATAFEQIDGVGACSGNDYLPHHGPSPRTSVAADGPEPSAVPTTLLPCKDQRSLRLRIAIHCRGAGRRIWGSRRYIGSGGGLRWCHVGGRSWGGVFLHADAASQSYESQRKQQYVSAWEHFLVL